jgi:hypothetical protein
MGASPPRPEPQPLKIACSNVADRSAVQAHDALTASPKTRRCYSARREPRPPTAAGLRSKPECSCGRADTGQRDQRWPSGTLSVTCAWREPQLLRRETGQHKLHLRPKRFAVHVKNGPWEAPLA